MRIILLEESRSKLQNLVFLKIYLTFVIFSLLSLWVESKEL